MSQQQHIERVVCGILLLYPDLIQDASQMLEPEHFTGQKTRSLYKTIIELHDAGEPIDTTTIKDRACRHGADIDLVDDISPVIDEAACMRSQLPRYIVSLRKARERRLVMDRITSMADKIGAGVVDPREMIDSIEGVLERDSHYIRSDIASALDKLEQYQLGKIDAYRYTGLADLDKYAPAKNELVILAGRPSIGKTSIAISLADRWAERGSKVLLCSLEMHPDDINIRRVAAITGIPQTRMRAKQSLSEMEWAAVVEAFARIKKHDIDILHGRMSLHDISAEIRRRKERAALDVVIIDHLGLMHLPDAERQDLRIGEVTASMASMAKRYDVTILLLHQLNRAPEQRESKRPSLADLRDSGRIEQDADCVWLLFRESYYDRDAGRQMQIIIAKNRNGKTGVANVMFDEETGRIE